MTFSRLTGLTLVALLLSRPETLAQTSASGPSGQWFGVGPIGGLSTGMMASGPAVGAAASFDAGTRVTFEGRGVWMQRGGGTTGLEASGTMLLTVYRGETVAPYVGIGGGLYLVRFDLDSQRMFGGFDLSAAGGTSVRPLSRSSTGMMGGAGTTWVGVESGTAYDMAAMPMFYARRLGALQIPVTGQWGTRSFIDPAITVALGARVALSPRWYVRPDLRAVVPVRNGDSLAVVTATMAFGVRF